jgi:hypothetical protein
MGRVRKLVVGGVIFGLVSILFWFLCYVRWVDADDDVLDGLNYETEWSETNANRHVQIVDAMIKDGMQGS